MITEKSYGRIQFSGDPAQLTALLTAIVIAASAIAWLAMVFLHGGAGENWMQIQPKIQLHLHHHSSGGVFEATRWSVRASLQWLAGWLIMVVAMMLPSALPFLHAITRLTHGLPQAQALIATAAAAFLGAWGVAGVVLVVAGGVSSHLLAAWPWLASQPALISGLAAIFVGAYQLSPLKQACLTACRSPTGLMMVTWKDDRPWRSIVEIGIRYALICIGCCWTLMLLTVVVGAFVLPLMVIVSVMMVLERLLPAVRPLIPLQAVFAGSIGLLLLMGSLPPGLVIGGAGQ